MKNVKSCRVLPDEERKNVTAMLVKMLGVDEALVAKKLDKKKRISVLCGLGFLILEAHRLAL